MSGLAKAYFLWQTPSSVSEKAVEYVRTRDGRTITRVEWNKKAFEEIKEEHQEKLLEAIEDYVSVSCPWVKSKNIKEYSMDCLLKGSYRHWKDFKRISA